MSGSDSVGGKSFEGGSWTSMSSTLRFEFGTLIETASEEILAARKHRALLEGWGRAWPFLLLVPLTLFAVRLVGTLPVSTGVFVFAVFATLAIPAAVALWPVWRASKQPVDPRDALAALDAQFDLEDRLVTAHEFASLRPAQDDPASPFVAAALEDAAEVALPRIGSRKLRLERPDLPFGLQQIGLALGAVSLLFLAGLFGGSPEPSRTSLQIQVTSGQELTAAATEEETRTRLPEVTQAEEGQRAAPKAVPPTPGTDAESSRDKPGELSEATKESDGKTGEGRSADAESATGASESRGTPSNQSQQSKASEKPKSKAKKKKKPKPAADLLPTEKKNAEENSGSTAGKGSSKGSNKNPAVSKWSSKDQVTTEDDQEINEDEDTEDEEEDQESRGGMQPNLRNRKPPASRDLQISFGNQKNPDANGRGGPSEAKKSRGTASLVLGVPIPDRVKGQPNPGKTKISQERIEPKAEESETVQASDRSERDAPIGVVEQHELSPWMRDLVRGYFLSLRNESPKP